MYVPHALVPEVMDAFHAGSTLGAHFGVKKLYPVMVDEFFWPHMFDSLRTYVQGCLICQQFRSGPLRGIPRMPHETAIRPMDIVSVDTIALPRTDTADKALVAVDWHTRFVGIPYRSDRCGHRGPDPIRARIRLVWLASGSHH